MRFDVEVIGGGLAGVEAAFRLARMGFSVGLYEMRPERRSPVHRTHLLGELVCSNSLGADQETSPAGILKAELRRLGSPVMASADRNRVPAGRALAVDREGFARDLTDMVSSLPNVTVVRREVTSIPTGPCILATGPLTEGEMAEALRAVAGGEDGRFLYFYDAASPIVTIDSVDMSRAYRGSRYGQGEDYVNCPLTREEYLAFWEALVSARQAPRHQFEEPRFFEGCLPVEEIARRGVDTLRFGPMRPVGLPGPDGREPYAVVQLRQDDREGRLYNLVGFQTNLLWGEQERVFRMIPALRDAEFVRKGVMHRNLYVCAPKVLDGYLRPLGAHRRDLFLAGQITGVEGYLESAAMGLCAAMFMGCVLKGLELPHLPPETALGSLLRHLREARPEGFQPMNVNLGIFPPLEERIRDRRERCARYFRRALEALEAFLRENPHLDTAG
ncbi:methylenetetrahydrofolate--tRNA-(uracil(54)-C(5))-methyltransferase (FADH(2)-oxidizing) TrmFO [Thermanaerovibrio acidaminovorans]|jgi:methylenetetrahydrofolate--tRNA-(uracil-5-)-methyltransferase|uniref:methylenetetrahydrofolate--tRNA-(uracil(54)- C(5))-methyltransferase (FADH(2)-oxidizing) TrmFO n=1 Tax=Thermanaerovibrio acidaminovorans TaxID=81462 RepID=UPI002492EDF0|nr:methylenetetrahydrofolate--tRNA-(uracil(54)-C(5))-methyltransferase (FADH(2)-oxidizing) TrmFO [Thermanaerovibrio acidaminovorans]